MVESSDKSSVFKSNENYIKDDSFMKMRLDTNPLIVDMRLFLSSKEMSYIQTEQGWVEKENQIGLPLANPEGVLRICNIVRMRVNLHVGQGNLKEDHYWDFITRARKELTETIVKKCYDWEINDNDLNTVIDEIMALVECFMTRPIDNLERQSFGQSYSQKEVITNPNQRKNMSDFANSMGGGRSS